MIISDDFVWIHFPKAAGSKVEILFKKNFSADLQIHQDRVGLHLDPSVSWHDSISDREKRDPSFRLGNRCLIVCTRRLPSWLKSRFQFEVKRNPQLKHDPELLCSGRFLERTGRVNHADSYIRKWIDPSLRRSHPRISFIRVEYFARDFKNVFGKYLDISRISDSELDERENPSSAVVSHESLDKLIAENHDAIYQACPLWSELEKCVYGDIGI